MKHFKTTFFNFSCVKESAISLCNHSKTSEKQAIRNYSKSELEGRNFIYLLSGLFILFLVIPANAYAQKIDERISVKLGGGVANQTWKPYQSDYLEIESDPITRPFMSISFDTKLSEKFSLRKSLSYKIKGVKNIKTKNHGYTPNLGQYNSSPEYFKNYYSNRVLAASGSLLFFPFGLSENAWYCSAGIGIDYLISKKPMVHERFPYNVEVYFSEDDYKRATLFGSLVIGIVFSEYFCIEFEYAPSITRSLKVRQMQISENYWSISLGFIGKSLLD